MKTLLSQTAGLLAAVIIVSTASAQWPADPAVNLPLGYGPGEQVVPKVAVVPEGGDYAGFMYVGWYDNASGNYDVGLQLLTPDGVAVFADGGMIVSDQPQDSWVMEWSLAADAQGNALVSFADIRDGNSNIHVYKISPEGEFLWGPTGLDVTDDADFKGPPSVTAASDGQAVVAWMQSGEATVMRMQRYTADGTPLLAAGGVVVSELDDEAPAGNVLVPTVDGDVILGYVPRYVYMGNRQIKAQRFDEAGAAVWPAAVWVMDDASMPMGHYFRMTPDGLGGALFSWDLSVGWAFDARVQRLDADGGEMLDHNGLAPEANGPDGQLEPSAVFNPATGDVTMVYVDMNSTQSERGLNAQRFDAAGNRLWGAGGTILLPRDPDLESLPALAFADGAVIGFVQHDMGGAWGTEVLYAFGIDDAGDLMWGGVVPAATTPCNKGDLLAAFNGLTVIGVWEDDRNGTPDTYAQNINLDGTLGPIVVANEDEDDPDVQPALPADFAALPNYPNPFNPSTTIAFDLPAAGPVSLRVFDARGALVRELVAANLAAAHHTVVWDGTDESGRPLPSGVYYYHLETMTNVATRPMTLLK